MGEMFALELCVLRTTVAPVVFCCYRLSEIALSKVSKSLIARNQANSLVFPMLPNWRKTSLNSFDELRQEEAIIPDVGETA